MSRVTRLAYVDTSVLIKRYVKEPDSSRAGGLLKRHDLLTSSIVFLEALSAFSRRRGTGELLFDDFSAIVTRLRDDRRHWRVVELTDTVLGKAEDLIPRTSVRALDAIHLASALIVKSSSGIDIPFITADARQRSAAQSEGLRVLWVS